MSLKLGIGTPNIRIRFQILEVGSKLKNVEKWSHEEVFPEYNTQGAQNVNNQIYEKALNLEFSSPSNPENNHINV